LPTNYFKNNLMATYILPELDSYPDLVVKIPDPDLAKRFGSDWNRKRISNYAWEVLGCTVLNRKFCVWNNYSIRRQDCFIHYFFASKSEIPLSYMR
jgi:hypothetical protein